MSLVVTALACAAMSLMSTVVAAQATKDREAFEVASIREHQSTATAPPEIRQHPLGLTARNVTVQRLIRFAFGVIDREIVGELPGWVTTTQFDVEATAAQGPLTHARLRAMTKVLLEDRFRLDAIFERTEGPVYALVMARPDGKIGPGIRPSDSTCPDAPIEVRDQAVRVLKITGCGTTPVFSGGELSALFGLGITLPQFARELSRVGGYDRPVLDRTGLEGQFDITAVPTRDMTGATRQARFMIALREQLGLTLRSERGFFEVLRIRRIERPSGN